MFIIVELHGPQDALRAMRYPQAFFMIPLFRSRHVAFKNPLADFAQLVCPNWYFVRMYHRVGILFF